MLKRVAGRKARNASQMKKPKQAAPDAIRFRNALNRPPNVFSLMDLSEADIRQLHDGVVPDWIIDTTAWFLRDNPKPSDVPPKPKEETEAVA